MAKKWIASILLVSLLGSLVSCGGQKEPITETPADNVPSEEQNTQETYASSIPAQDFSGEKIKVLTFTTTEYMNSAQDINAAELTGELLNDAVYIRNELLTEKFNIQLDISDAGTFQDIIKVVNDTVIAGDTEALDILMGSAYSMTTCGLAGSIRNMKGLPYIDLEKPWWNKTVAEESSILNTNYFLIGDMNLDAWTQSYVTYFNPEMAAEYNVEDLYQLVRDNKWTLEKMDTLTRSVYVDTNGNGEYDENDTYGLSACSVCIDCFWASGGVKFIVKDANDAISLQFSNQFYDMYDSITALLAAPEMLFTDRPKYAANRAVFDRGAFMENRALFFIEALCVGDYTLRDMESTFGILPVPKYSEEQDVYSTFSHTIHNSTVSLPITVTGELDKLCMILEDMAFYSMDTVRSAYYDKMLDGRLAQNAESAEMLDIVTQNISYDITFLLFYLDLIQSGTGLRTVIANGGPSGSFVASQNDPFSLRCEEIMETIRQNNENQK